MARRTTSVERQEFYTLHHQEQTSRWNVCGIGVAASGREAVARLGLAIHSGVF